MSRSLLKTATLERYGSNVFDAEASGVVPGSNSNGYAQLNAVLSAAAQLGNAEVVLRAHSYDCTGGRVLVPAGITLRGDPSGGTVLMGGAYAIASKGAIRDVQIDSGWTEQPSILLSASVGGTAIMGGRVINVSRQNDATILAPSHTPHGLLPVTISKLRSNSNGANQLKVGIYGMSIMEDAGTSPYWQNLVFQTGNSSYFLGTYFPGAGAALNVTSTIINKAVGGTYSDLLLAHCAVERSMLNSGGNLLNAADGRSYNEFPRLADHDLIIVGDVCNDIGAGFTGSYPWNIETFVKTARDLGVEVMLVLENDHNAVASPDVHGIRELYQRIAQAYGAVLVDVNARYYTSLFFGDHITSDLYVDSIHPTALGQQIYAQAIVDAFLDHDPRLITHYRPPKRRVFQQNYLALNQVSGNTIWESRYTPTAQSAGVSSVASTGSGGNADTTGTKHPHYRTDGTHTYAPSATPITQIPNGEWVEFAVEGAADMVLVYEQTASTPTVSVTSNAGATTIVSSLTLLGNNTGRHMANHVGRTRMLAVNSRTIRVTATSGTVNLLCALFEVLPKRGPFRNADGTLTGATRQGTWTSAASTSLGLTNLEVTDTTNDLYQIDVFGDSVWIALGSSPYAGQVTITVDDVVYASSQELYQAGATNLYTLIVPNLGNGRHRVQVKLVGVNGSATAVSTSAAFGHRLTIYDISGVLSDNRSTLTDLMDTKVADPKTSLPSSVSASPGTWSWFGPLGANSGTASLMAANGTATYVPIMVTTAMSIDQIGVNVTTGGSSGALVRLGLRASDANGMPGALVVDGGTIDGTTTGYKQASVSAVLSPGLYWAEAVCQGAPVTVPTLRYTTCGFQTVGSGQNNWDAAPITYQETGVTGAFAASVGTLSITNASNKHPVLTLHRSA